MTNKIQNKLPKEERLCREKVIDNLFKTGNSFAVYPIRIVYSIDEISDSTPSNGVSILVSVSKKKFKRAVKRNRIKRLIREAYRLNKLKFTNLVKDKSLNIAFIYLKNELVEYKEIEKAIIKIGDELELRVNKNNEKTID